MQKAIVAGAAVSTVVAGIFGIAWLGLGEPSAAVAAAPGAATPVAPAGAAERPDLTPIRLNETPLDPTAAEAVETPEPLTRVDVAPTAAENQIAVAVIDGDSNPLAGAEVLVLADASDEQQKTFRDLDQVDAYMREHAAPRRTSAEGLIYLERPAGRPTLILAQHASLWGKETILQSSTDPALVLGPDATLRARVVDPTGQPVQEATVELLRLREWGPRSVRSAPVTGEQAIATFRHAQLSIFPVDDDSWAIGVDALLREDVAQPLDPEELPADVVTLVVPVAGSVAVKVLDEAWSPFTGKARVSLGIVREGEPRKLSPFSEIRRTRVLRDAEDGIALFPLVDVGSELEILVTRDGSRIPTRAFEPGPQRAGEQVRIDVQLGADHPVVLLHVVGQGGKTLANTKLNVRIHLTTPHISNAHDIEVQTVADGSFRVDVEGDWTEGAERTLVVTRGRAEDPDASGEVDLARKLQPGLNDLGFLTLAESPLFVRGRVVTPGGDRIPGAKLLLHRRTEEQNRWDQDWHFRHESDENGEFEIRGLHAGSAFRLGASRAGWAGTLNEFAPGEAALVVQMTREGALEGRVLLDERIPMDVIRIHVEDGRGRLEHLDQQQRSVSIAEDGSFRMGQLHPGLHKLKLRIDSHHDDLREIEDIPVHSNETTRDSRLTIDLRGALFARNITFVTEETETRLQGSLAFGPAGAEELELGRWFHQREFLLISEDEVLDVAVSARGYRNERLEGVRGDVELRLTRGLRVRIVLGGDAALPDPPLFVKAVLAPVDGEHSDIDWGAPAFDEQREIVVRVPRAGQMKVRWILERRSSTSSSATIVDLDPEQLVEVDDLQDQRIEVSLTDAQMQSILSRFQ